MKISNGPPPLTRLRLSGLAALLCLLVVLGAFQSAYPQSTASSTDRERGRTMLKVIKDDLKKNYYDPSFHGMDVDARFKAADEKIKQATSLGQVLGIIAQVLIELDDSHTFFLPPERAYRTDYGWQMQMIGDNCYVVAVKPGSDAEAKGLKEGDQIYSVDGRAPTRETMWKLQYLYHTLRPQPGMSLVVQSPGGQQRRLEVLAKVQQGKRIIDLTGGSDIWDLMREGQTESRLHRHRYVEMGDDLFIWKMPQFDLPKQRVDEMMDKVRKYRSLILDLRGNGGGYEETMLRLIGNFFDHDVQVGELKGRKDRKPVVAKTRGSHSYAGKVVVLVDSQSGSAAELLARVIQLERRGAVIGDRSAGAVMQAKHYPHELGLDTVVPYGVSITSADIIMADGQSLEHAGVTPDELVLPAATDLAAKRDPVLSRAASLVGIKLGPEKAGALFPIEWRK